MTQGVLGNGQVRSVRLSVLMSKCRGRLGHALPCHHRQKTADREPGTRLDSWNERLDCATMDLERISWEYFWRSNGSL